jgi:hypothetical protein
LGSNECIQRNAKISFHLEMIEISNEDRVGTVLITLDKTYLWLDRWEEK